MRVLLGLEACDEVLAAVPLLRALRARGLAVQLAWFGSDRALLAARALGLGDEAVEPWLPTDAQSATASAARRCADAATFAARLLADSWRAVLTIGSGPFAIALGCAASRLGLCVLRAMAGVRTQGGSAERQQRRRLADHAANAWCTTNDDQRRDLLREGLATDRVVTVGSLIGEAMAALPTAPPAPLLWLALEHEETLADPARLATVVEAVSALAQQHHLRVRAVPRGDDAATPDGAADQLSAARSARAIITDSAGYQELAAAANVPCVVVAGAGLRTDLLWSGANLQLAPSDVTLPQCLERALDAARCPAPPPAAAAAAVGEHLQRLLATAPAAAGAEPAVSLPSDADHSGRTLGEDEVALVAAAVRSGTLNSTRGTFVTTFERRFAAWLGRKHVIACASGSAAVHCAVAALGLTAGDEVITTPITDMGALTPMLYEGAVPVFADVDARTLNVTAATIAARLTARTRAIVVTHLFGLPCEMDAILRLAAERCLPVIEDAAQAFGATHRGRKVGTFGALAAFSLQQGKHITTGEGGLVATDDDALARRVFLCVNKAWGYGDAKPDHYFPALNYRLTELQGAVACAQLPKLDWVVQRRRDVAAALREALRDLPALQLPVDPPHGTHSFWKFAFFVDPTRVAGGAVALGRRMQASGIACVPRYIQKPAFECQLFREWQRSPVTQLPLQANGREAGSGPLFDRRDFPGAVLALDEVLVLPINERYEPQHVHRVATGIRHALQELHV